VSRWLQQKVIAQLANVTFFDVLETSSGMQLSTSTCKSWVSSNGLTHDVLRDKSGGIESTFGMSLSDVMVVDGNMKIVFKGQVVDTLSENQLLNALNALP
jgi:hypothetical protein